MIRWVLPIVERDTKRMRDSITFFGSSILQRLKGAGLVDPAPVLVEVIFLSACALFRIPPFIGFEA